MSKPLHAGIDVGSRELVVALERSRGGPQILSFSNDPDGHKMLLSRLARSRRPIRVVMEATGVYGLDLAITLSERHGIEIMVANPRTVRDFARASFQRSKTDVCDAVIILEFSRRMPFQPWSPPPRQVFDLRAIARRISRLKLVINQERNRLHAAGRCRDLDPILADSIQEHIDYLQESIERLSDQALSVICSQEVLEQRYRQLISVKGIGQLSAVRILAELSVLPADMTVRQWVAHSGLDPRHNQSGTSLDAPARISRMGNVHLRSALYMPALVAIRFEPHIAAYYQHLIQRGKKPMQAIVAVMRKLLHSIYGMFRTGQEFIPEKFYALNA